jgi:transposase
MSRSEYSRNLATGEYPRGKVSRELSPSCYEFSGERVKRGMYKSRDGNIINADYNGAANIMKKVATQLGLNKRRGG